MTEAPVIQFENVSKRFDFHRNAPNSILETAIAVFSRKSKPANDKTLWALRHVSFDVRPGEALGIIGQNGSGKSTVLKLITRILKPNDGRIVVRGKVSALLELGAGFHPDLTGRENIFLNAAVLGLDQAEVEAVYDDIVAFSELGDFINMPVKHYSSGMYMRLGFSVAIHVQPDILIVDEILAVGDQNFQRKCMDQIYSMKDAGVTIVMVSHNLSILRRICSRLLWLDKGEQKGLGATEEVAADYIAATSRSESAVKKRGFAEFRRWGSGEIEITAVRFLDKNGQECDSFYTGEPITMQMDYVAHHPLDNPEFGFSVYRQDDINVIRPSSHLAEFDAGIVEGMGTISYHLDQLLLTPALYRVTASVYNGPLQTPYDHHDKAYSFRVKPTGRTQDLYGVVELPASWDLVPKD